MTDTNLPELFPKTYKREVSVLCIAATFAMALWGPEGMAEIFVWPVFMFAGAAFGLDAFAKQIR